ncbi:MAG: pyridoxal phosphate-dependent aminotransferase family protein [Bacteroidota bacterium]|nr:pyridoxal phosphate-dependent aminotransferase family protein [Bacteroidota bacterium]
MLSNKNPDRIKQALDNRKQNGLFRQLKTTFPSIDFCSNDYLGFSKLVNSHKSQDVSQNNQSSIDHYQPEGSTGSRLISGNSEYIEAVEKKIATFHSAESALIFNSGYDANLGLFSCVPQKGDLVIYDEFIHASIYDGIRLSHAKHYKFKHNDVNALKDLIERHKKDFQNIYIAVESIYSMDGDAAPLKAIVELIKNENAIFLIVDEAHAIGVFGTNGSGLCNQFGIENDCFARVYTFGKAMGCHGSAVVGSISLRDYLINFARSFIYTTALPKHSIDAINRAYKLLNETDMFEKLHSNISYFLSKTTRLSNLIKSSSAIQCLVIGDNKKVDDLEIMLAENNIYAKAIKSPTVKEGTERVRFCLHAFNTKKEIDFLIEQLSS